MKMKICARVLKARVCRSMLMCNYLMSLAACMLKSLIDMCFNFLVLSVSMERKEQGWHKISVES